MDDPSYVDKTITSLPAAPSRATDDAHYLLVLEGRARGERFELSGVHTVGRDVSCSIRLDDPSVSRVHCRIELRGEAVFVVDNGSTNGSFVEGYRVQARWSSRSAPCCRWAISCCATRCAVARRSRANSTSPKTCARRARTCPR